MENYINLLTIIRTRVGQTNSDPVWFLIGMVILFLFLIVIIVIIEKSEAKSDEQYVLKYKSEKYNLLYSTVKQTYKYYSINRFKNTVIFICAIISIFVGMYLFIYKSTIVGCVSGTISEFISATFFWIYKQCQTEEKMYSERLFKLRNLLTAMVLNDNIDGKNKSKKYDEIIEKLMD